DADPLKTPLAAPSRRRLNLSCNASEPPLRNSLSSPKNFEDGQRQQSLSCTCTVSGFWARLLGAWYFFLPG
ncbi:MAG: hypothetical protein AAF636_03610, partial [Pseudomonadota bacterium]